MCGLAFASVGSAICNPGSNDDLCVFYLEPAQGLVGYGSDLCPRCAVGIQGGCVTMLNRIDFQYWIPKVDCWIVPLYQHEICTSTSFPSGVSSVGWYCLGDPPCDGTTYNLVGFHSIIDRSSGLESGSIGSQSNYLCCGCFFTPSSTVNLHREEDWLTTAAAQQFFHSDDRASLPLSLLTSLLKTQGSGAFCSK